MSVLKKVVKEVIPYILIVIFVIFIKTYIVTPIRVNGPSMNDTLHNKDIMLLDEISYKFNDIKRFDIVVLKYEDEYIIKRVVGLPGEELEVKDNRLYINGKIVKQDFNHAETKDIEKVIVEENCYYVLGDNRINSVDSRIIGSVNKNRIKGKAIFTIYPFNRFGKKD